MRFDRRLLGWGLFFILAGGIPLLVRANVLDAGVVGRWPSLWPLLLIGWGLSLILRRTPVAWTGGAIAALAFGAMAGGALATGLTGLAGLTGCADDAAGTAFETRTGAIAGSGQLSVTFNCGTLAVGTTDGADWTLSGSDPTGGGPRINADAARTSLESDREGDFFAPGGKTSWNLLVPKAVRLAFGLTLNAGEADVDLTGATLSSLNVTVNAGAVNVDLANAVAIDSVNATVNGGDTSVSLPAAARVLNLSLNLGNLDVCLPAGTPVRVSWSGALASNDFEDQGLVEANDNTWTSVGFNPAQPFVELHVSANVGSFGLQFGGTCGA
jgi:hypothetical protein